MNANHTPGPWFAHEPVNKNRKDFGVTAGRPYDPSTGAVRRIAWVGNASNPAAAVSEEVRANARLIAASPTMFEALKGLLSIDENTDPLIAKAAWMRAADALSKAQVQS